jgi:hypothetical protein
MLRQRWCNARGDPLLTTNDTRGERAPHFSRVLEHAPLSTLSAADYELARPAARLRLYISGRSSGKRAHSTRFSPYRREQKILLSFPGRQKAPVDSHHEGFLPGLYSQPADFGRGQQKGPMTYGYRTFSSQHSQ